MLLAAEMKRGWKMFLRYPVEAVISIVMLTLVFSGLILAARYLAGPAAAFGNRLDSLLIGYAIWTVTMGVCGSLASEVEQETASGTLEQLVMSKRSFAYVQICRAASALTIYLTITTAVLAVLMLIAKPEFAASWAALVPAALLFLGATGVGLVLSALTLLTKRAVTLLAAAHMLLLVLLMFPLEAVEAVRRVIPVLPLAASAVMLRDVLVRGEALEITQTVLAALNSTLLLAAGIFACRAALNAAARNATLGHH